VITYWGLRKYDGDQDLIWGNHNGCEHEWQPLSNNRGNGDGQSFRRDKAAGIERGSIVENQCIKCGSWKGAYGLEPTVDMYVEHTVEILRAIRRVLKTDGTVWLNLGDSYYGGGGAHKPDHANPGISNSAQRGGVPHVGQNGKHGKVLLDSLMRDSFFGSPCGECAKMLLTHSLDTYDCHVLILAISGVLSSRFHKAQQPDHSENSHLTYQAAQNADGILGPCSFVNFVDAITHDVRESTNHVFSGEFPHCLLAPSCLDSQALTDVILPESQAFSDKTVCPFWNYLLLHGIQGLLKRISCTLEIHGASGLRIKDMVSDYSSLAYSIIPQRPLKPKDLCLIPFRVSLAAQADGWWVRSVIIWNKPNPMPESCKDRPTESHEYILMLTKSRHYYFDMEAVREPQSGNSHDRGDAPGDAAYQEARGSYFNYYHKENYTPNGSRNIRSVWDITTQPFKDAHFATFPEEIPKRCILASTSEKGNCAKCGKPWVRVVKTVIPGSAQKIPSGWDIDTGAHGTIHRSNREDANTRSAYEKGTTANRLALLRQQARETGGEYTNETVTLGWKPSCKCGADVVKPVVLDPFGGSGTTNKVAKELGRKSIYIDTSEKYCEMARKRIMLVTLPMEINA